MVPDTAAASGRLAPGRQALSAGSPGPAGHAGPANSASPVGFSRSSVGCRRRASAAGLCGAGDADAGGHVSVGALGGGSARAGEFIGGIVINAYFNTQRAKSARCRATAGPLTGRACRVRLTAFVGGNSFSAGSAEHHVQRHHNELHVHLL